MLLAAKTCDVSMKTFNGLVPAKALRAASPRVLRVRAGAASTPPPVDALQGLVAKADALCGRLQAMMEMEVPRVTVLDKRDLLVFDARQISRFYAAGKYTAFRIGGREYLVTETLQALTERLEQAGFMRLHRSELVNLNHITRVRRQRDLGNAILKDGQEAQVSRKMVTLLCNRLLAQ